MKQTNSAIKFLMAQYRSIFKQAYLKGLVSAVALTAGLATSSAPFAADDEALGDLADLANSGGVFVNVESSIKDSSLDSANGAEITWDASLTLSGSSSGSLTITNASASAGDITLSGSGVLSITGDESDSGTFTLDTDGVANNNIALNIKEINVQDYGVFNATAGSGNVTVGGEYATGLVTTINLAEKGVINLTASTASGSIATLSGKLNASGGTINVSGSGSVISTYGANLNLNLNVAANAEAETDNSLVIALGPDNTKTADVENLLQITKGSVVIDQAGEGSGSGLLDIQAGTLEITGETVLIAKASDAEFTEGPATAPMIQVSGDSADDAATLKIDQDILANYVSGKAELKDADGETVTATKGGVLVSGTGTLFINATDESGIVDLSDGSLPILSGSGAETLGAGEIVVDGGTIASTIIAISEVNEDVDLSKASIKADKLNLGSATLEKADTAKIGFSGGTVSTEFNTQASGGVFTLASDVTLDRNFFQKNADNTNKTNTDGTPIYDNVVGKITGADLELGGTATLAVTSGKWEGASGLDITVNDGTTLQVESVAANTDTVSSSQYLNTSDTASLKLNGKLTLNSGSVNVSGDKGADAILDLSSADVVFTSGSFEVKGSAIELSDKTNGFLDIDAAKKFYADAFENKVGLGKLILKNSDFTEYLDANNSAIKIDNDGVVEITDASRRTLDIGKFDSAQSGSIAFTGAGYLIYDADMLIRSSGDETAALNIGAGTIIANRIDISAAKNKAEDADSPIHDTSIVGNLILSTGLSTNSSLLTLGNSNNSGAQITLNTGVSNAEGLLSVGEQGTISLSGGTATSAIYVKSGVWTNSALDISVDGGAAGTGVFVGSDDETDPTASFTANNFKSALTAANDTLTVYEKSSAAFTSMQLTSTDSVKVYGHLSLAGRDIDSGEESVDPLKDAETVNGISLNGATFEISGSSAELEFGANASSALVNFSGNTSAAEGESQLILTSGGISGTKFNLTDFGTLKFNFGESVKLSATDLNELTELLGIDQAVGTTGYLNIGDADIDVVVTEDENGNYTAAWEDNVENFVGVTAGGITSNKLEKALITGITSTDNVQGKFGALQTDSKYNIVITGATSLGNAQSFGGYYAFYVDAQGNKHEVGLSLDADLNLKNGGIVGEIDAGGNKVVLSSDNGNTDLIQVKGSVSNASEFDVQTATTVQK